MKDYILNKIADFDEDHPMMCHVLSIIIGCIIAFPVSLFVLSIIHKLIIV